MLYTQQQHPKKSTDANTSKDEKNVEGNEGGGLGAIDLIDDVDDNSSNEDLASKNVNPTQMKATGEESPGQGGEAQGSIKFNDMNETKQIQMHTPANFFCIVD